MIAARKKRVVDEKGRGRRRRRRRRRKTARKKEEETPTGTLDSYFVKRATQITNKKSLSPFGYFVGYFFPTSFLT
jgi:hypothetical protein